MPKISLKYSAKYRVSHRNLNIPCSVDQISYLVTQWESHLHFSSLVKKSLKIQKKSFIIFTKTYRYGLDSKHQKIIFNFTIKSLDQNGLDSISVYSSEGQIVQMTYFYN